LKTANVEGAVSVYARLAKLLNVRIDDLVAEMPIDTTSPG